MEIEGIEQFVRLMHQARMLDRQRPEGWAYATSDELLLRHGRLYRPVPRPSDVRRGAPNDCFRNATDIATERRYTYVEGYANGARCIIPVHHAWVTVDGETAVDPTWDDGAVYFGVAFDIDWLWDFLGRTGYFGVLDSFRVDLLAELLRDGLPQGALV